MDKILLFLLGYSVCGVVHRIDSGNFTFIGYPLSISAIALLMRLINKSSKAA